MPATTVAPLHKLIGLEVRFNAGNDIAAVGHVVDAKSAYGQIRVLVKGPELNGPGDVTAWVDATRCTFATPNGMVAGHKVLATLGGAA